MTSFASVVTPRVVFVLLDDRAEFDRLDLSACEHPLRENGERCISKALEDEFSGVKVIFQHWIGAPK